MHEDIQKILSRPELSTCLLSDALDFLGIYGVVCHDVKHLNEKRKFVGQAYTVQWEENRKQASILDAQQSTWSQVRDFLAPQLNQHEGKGKVYVAGAGRLIRHAALAGGMSTTYLREQIGFEGMVVGGALRDQETILGVDIPVMGTNFVPVDTQGAYRVTEVGTFCMIDNLRIQTGDWIVGDGNGVLCIPQDKVRLVLECAVGLADRERLVMSKIKGGTRLPDIVDQVGSI